ncbi:DUF4254 domain-containing protein [Nocardia ninae]|uniref:DUF4254 domain-containing protein n=1 Tax=Nocardia ninae NBRC 108245 TaxID=1210091 RepID=A0A511MDL0_9NOCA|nr:DUF4254 domain-containing protein [Nocardia ninae]GEM38237.1 hypothetical protein NN4_27560 [Nocardia ninae NBRC 108245]
MLSLPSDDELFLAIRGQLSDEHRLCQLANELGQLHWQQLVGEPTASEIHCKRAELIHDVDSWVSARLPIPHRSATLHTETLGQVVDRFAGAVVHAYHLLMTLEPDDVKVHAAWYRLAELADGYTDLCTEVSNRARRLPALGDRH